MPTVAIAGDLVQLLKTLGYQKGPRVYGHPERKMISVNRAKAS